MAYVNKKELAKHVDSVKSSLKVLNANGDKIGSQRLVHEETPLFYLTHFSNDELVSNEDVLNYLSQDFDETVKRFGTRGGEVLDDMLQEKKQAILEVAMRNPDASIETLRKMIIRKFAGKADFSKFGDKVKELPEHFQEVIEKPEDVWKICDSAQMTYYHVPAGKEWEVLDWVAKNAPEKFSPMIHTRASNNPFSRNVVVERYSQMPQEELPEVVKDYIARSNQYAIQKVEANDKLREYHRQRREARRASWLDEDGRLLNFFKLEDNFPITSPEDYFFIAETFKNSGMTAYAFCKQFKISDTDGFRDMLKKVAQNDPEFAEFYEQSSQQNSRAFLATTRADIVAVATKRKDVAEVIDSSTDSRDFEKMISIALRIFDRPIVAGKFAENVISYYYDRMNSYGEYATDEKDLKNRLTKKEIKFLMGAELVDDLNRGKNVDFSQALGTKLMPVVKYLGKDTRVQLYDGKTGLKMRIRPYSARFERGRYLSDVVEFMLSDGRGVAVEPSMVDNAECFVHDHKLFKSAGVMTRVVKAVAEGKIQNSQETADYHARLQRRILKNIEEVRSLEQYFGRRKKDDSSSKTEEKKMMGVQM